MGINLKTDFSFLFSGLGGNSGSSGMSTFLSDYSSIKNGSYGKLMKAYYGQSGSDSTKKAGSSAKSSKTTVDDIINDKMKRERKVETQESKAYTQVKSATNNLKTSADKLSAQGSRVLFEKKNITATDENGVESTSYDYDKEAIYKAVNKFVSDYNSVLQTAGSVSSSSVSNRVAAMEKDTYTNKDALKQFGIAINVDNSLSIDKDTFMKADMSMVERAFKDTGYARSVAENASMINYNANYEQLRANTYTYDGMFDSTYNTGSSYSASL